MRSELEGLPEPNWFHHGPQILDLLEIHRPKVCVELGSNRGCSAIAVARLIRQWGGRLTCVDLWEPHAPPVDTVGIDEFVWNVSELGLIDIISTLQMTTAEAARRWVQQIDYLYIDADHTYEGCTSDLELWWPFLRVGGLIAGDDYDDPYGDPKAGVTRAWDEFELLHEQEFKRTTTPGLVHASRLIWGVKR